jgi:hypothetical protein
VSIGLLSPRSRRPGEQLRDQWRTESLAASWCFPDDWWCPAVDAVIEAIVEHRAGSAPAAELGRHRARSAVSLSETLDDLSALVTVVGEQAVPRAMFSATALGWADVTSSAQIAGGCIDPLTGLATPAYLRSRLGEVYAEAQRSGSDAGERYALVVADVGTGGGVSPFGAMTALICLRENLAAVFSGGETIAATGPGRAVVLAARDDALVQRLSALRHLQDARGEQHRTWIERLPSTLISARELVADLGR